MFDYDIRDGIRLNDRMAVSFEYDERPIVPGEMGAGTLVDTEDNRLAPADRNHMAIVNNWRKSKGLAEYSVDEYLATQA